MEPFLPALRAEGHLEVLDALGAGVDRVDDDVVEGAGRRRHGHVVFLVDGAQVAQPPENPRQITASANKNVDSK